MRPTLPPPPRTPGPRNRPALARLLLPVVLPVLLPVLLLAGAGSAALPAQHASVFGGGPLYHRSATVFPQLKASGFTTILFWSVHVYANGDLVLNGDRIVSNGRYVGRPGWPAEIASLKTPPTTIERIEFSVGSAGVRDFETIEALIRAQGNGPSSILYRNFAALLAAIPSIDAIDFDDESNYDVQSAGAFADMLARIGYRVTFCPYTARAFWRTLYARLQMSHPGVVDRVYLQCYAGGTGNDPAAWNADYPGLEVSPGLWCRHGTACAQGDAPGDVARRMLDWENGPGIDGGFLWLLDDLLACEGSFPIPAYADAIRRGVGFGSVGTYGLGCGAGRVEGRGAVLGGRPFAVDLRGAEPGSTALLLLSGRPTIRPLDGFGLTGCYLNVDLGGASLALPLAVDAAGTASLGFVAPAGLRGSFYAQAVVPQPGLNRAGHGTTRGLAVTWR